MRVYISGPITGIPDGNKQSFLLAAVILRECGHDPVNPHELGHAEGDAWETCMRRDIAALMTCNALAFLPGSMESVGAQIEIQTASSVKIPTYDITNFISEMRDKNGKS